jgi:hypothetical protein
MNIYVDHGREMLPAGPFREWLTRQLDPEHTCPASVCDGLHDLSDRLGVSERSLHRYRRAGYVRLDAVDAAACALDSHINEIYGPSLTVFAPDREWHCEACGAPLIKRAPICGLCQLEASAAQLVEGRGA